MAGDLTLANIPYQQVDFDPATGRYVRLTLLSRYANRDDSFGVTELQLFTVPEPTAVATVLPALLSALPADVDLQPDPAMMSASAGSAIILRIRTIPLFRAANAGGWGWLRQEFRRGSSASRTRRRPRRMPGW